LLARKIASAKKEAAKARASKKLVLSVAEGFLPPTPFFSFAKASADMLFARPTCPDEVLTQAERNFSKVVVPTSLKLRGASGIFLKMSSNFF